MIYSLGITFGTHIEFSSYLLVVTGDKRGNYTLLFNAHHISYIQQILPAISREFTIISKNTVRKTKEKSEINGGES